MTLPSHKSPTGQIPPLGAGAGDLDETELLAHAVAVGLPMNTKFRGTTYREALLVKGPHGWAEFSPFPEYQTPEAANWLAATIEAGWHGWPEPRRTQVPVNATVPAVPAADVPTVLARYQATDTVKIKVAEKPAVGAELDPAIHGMAADIARVAAVREALPHAKLRIDGNEAYTVEEAAQVLEHLEPYGMEYAEQPVAGIDGLVALRSQLEQCGINITLAADEAVRKAGDPLEVARRKAAGVVVVKVQPLGGVRRALAIVESAGLQAVVSSALDTSVGIAGGVALAASLPELNFACGLGTAALFAEDVVHNPLKPAAGVLSAPAKFEIDETALQRLELDPERSRWWMDRARAALRYLGSQG